MELNYKKILDDVGINAFLITDPYSLRYYTGFRGGEGVALITDHYSCVLITDSRYTEAAEKECYDGFVVEQFDSKRSRCDILMDYITNDRVGLLGFENKSISYNEYHQYSEILCNSAKYDALKEKRSRISCRDAFAPSISFSFLFLRSPILHPPKLCFHNIITCYNINQ